jgi:AcrR family transcriptional regulator
MVAPDGVRTPPADRRARRREATLAEIRERAIEIMGRVGVAGLTMTELARAMSIQPPSLYKYHPSVLAVYEDLFREGQQANLEALRAGMAGAPSGLPSVVAGNEAAARWAVANPVLAQLLFWRPVPGFVPSEKALAPAAEIVRLLRAALQDAIAAGQLGEEADSDRALELLSTLHFGMLSQHLANDPDADWDTGRYTRLYGQLMQMFVAAYPPPAS